MMEQISAILSSAIQTLEAKGNDNARREACWILEELLQLPSSSLAARLQQNLPEEMAVAFAKKIRRRASGEPLQYVIGNVDFYNVRLEVGPGVLIPRPETEELVEFAATLPFADASPHAICDVCTGSGAIALALATEFPKASVWATDISPEALAWAERNLRRLELANVTLLLGDLFAPLPTGVAFELITANPPYVSEADYAGLEAVIREHEPRLALVADDGGMALLKRIVSEAKRWLAPGGWLVCEIGDDQGAAMTEVLRSEGYGDVAVRQDMAHRDRIAVGRKN